VPQLPSLNEAVHLALSVAATDPASAVSGYGYGAAGILIVALLAFIGRAYLRVEKENTRLNEARVTDAIATQTVLGEAIAAIRENTRVSEANSRQFDRLVDQVGLFIQQGSVRSQPTPRRPTRGTK
jgi:hypothetical protein